MDVFRHIMRPQTEAVIVTQKHYEIEKMCRHEDNMSAFQNVPRKF